jgi:hypothetical protein
MITVTGNLADDSHSFRTTDPGSRGGEPQTARRATLHRAQGLLRRGHPHAPLRCRTAHRPG